MARDAELIIKIGANSKRYKQELNKIEGVTKASLKKITVASAAVFAAAAAGGISAFNQFTKFEDALIGVQKTTDITGEELKALKENISDLSGVLGQSQEGLLKIAESAGQLGVRGAKNLTKFTETIAKLNVASATLQGEVAAQQIAKILTITGEGFENVDRFASVIARLGDNFATTEAAIATTALEITKAGAQFGISASEAAGLAAAFEQLGVQPELARSTIVQSFLAIDKAIRGGGDELDKLSALTRMTGDQLRKTFKEDSVAVFQAFIGGLDSVQKQGGSVAAVLNEFGLGGTRLLAVLPTLAKGNKEVARALQLQGEEYVENTKLNEEFARKTTASSFAYDKLKVAINNAAIEIGKFIAPAAVSFAESLADEIDNLREGTSVLSPFLKEAGVQIGKLIKLFFTLKNIIFDLSTIITESLGSAFAFIISGFKDVQSIIIGFGATVNSALAKLPFLSDERRASFQEASEQALAAQKKYQEESKLLALEASKFFVDQETQKFLGVEEGLKSQADAEAELEQLRIERRISADEIELEALRKKEQEKLEIKIEARDKAEEEGVNLDVFSQTDEQFEESIEQFADRLQSLGDIENLSLQRRLDAAKTAADKRKIIEQEIVKAKTLRFRAEEKLDKDIVDSSYDALNAIIGDNKAAQTILFLAKKAITIGNILMSSKAAAALAMETVPPPEGEIIAAARIAAGKAAAAAVAVTALPQLIGTIGAQQGGLVPGGFGGGDRVPFMLEPGELIVPKQLTPTFASIISDLETGGSAGGGGIETQVLIGIEDDASRFITIKQREDKVLGI